MRAPLPRLRFFQTGSVVSNLIFLVSCWSVASFFSLALVFKTSPGVWLVWLLLLLGVTIPVRLLVSYSRPTAGYYSVQALYITFAISFIGKLISRFYYLEGLLDGETPWEIRKSGSYGLGGVYSYFAIFFYPAFIVICFCPTIKKIPKIVWLLTLCIIFFDSAVLGMRNAAIYVLIFAFVFRFKSRLGLPALIGVAILFLIFFKHTTELKNWAGPDMSWEVHLNHTVSSFYMQRTDLFGSVKNEFLLALIFLLQYLVHPIFELFHAIQENRLIDGLPLLYFRDQICVPLGCDYSDLISAGDSRYGVYKTAVYSFSRDFGPLVLPLFLGVFLYLCSFGRRRQNGLFYYWLIVVWILGVIENYVYGGLGLIQNMLIFVVLTISKVRLALVKPICFRT